MAIGIYGYPTNPSSGGSSGGGNTYEAGAGLKSTQTGSTTYSFSASGAFVTYDYNAAIEGSKALVEGNNVTFTRTATGIVINAQATGGGAPTTSSYITTTTEVTLPNSRVATSGNGVTVTDGGAGTTATFGLSSPVIQYPFVRYASSAGLFTNSKILEAGSGVTITEGSTSIVLSAAGGGGTVTSVDASVPSDLLTISGNPVTTSGTLAIGLTNAGSGEFFGGFSTGAVSAPRYRRLVYQDLPLIAGSNITLTPTGSSYSIASTASGSGSVTSVGLDLPADTFSISNSPVTTSGTLTGTFSNQASSTFHAGPTGGVATTPTWRGLVGQDLPVAAGANVQLTFNAQNQLVITASVSGGGGGTVTDFTAGNLSPLFTTSVATSTTTPALSFTLSSAPSSAVFAGPVSGANASPSFRALALNDMPTIINTFFSNTTPGVLVQTSAGVYTSRSVVGTSGYITVTNGNGVAGDVTLTTGASVYTVGNVIPVTDGGTGINHVPANGEIPIGNGDHYIPNVLTPGTGIQIANATGSITISASGALGGTVTSVDASVPASLLTLSGNPITTAGTLTIGLTNAASGQFWAGPTSGSAATPSYRSIVAGDLPSTIVNSSGNLSPLFTSSISNQALSFAQVAQASGLAFLSPASGADANPTFRKILGQDIQDALVAGSNVTLTLVGNQVSIASTGGGGSALTATSISSSATASVNTIVLVDLSSSNVTLALPSAASNSAKEVLVKIIATTSPSPYTLTINATATNGNGKIDGSASTISSVYSWDAWRFIAGVDGNSWYNFL